MVLFGLWSTVEMLRKLTIKLRLGILVVVPLLVLIGVMVTSLQTMTKLNSGMKGLYDDRIVALRQIKTTSDSYGITLVDSLHKYRAGLINRNQFERLSGQALDDSRTAWDAYMATQLTTEEEQLAATIVDHWDDARTLALQYIEMARNGSLLTLDDSEFNRELYTVFDPFTSALDRLITLQLDASTEVVNNADSAFKSLFVRLVVASILVIAILATTGILVYLSIDKPLYRLRTTIRDIAANNDLTLRGKEEGSDEIAELASDFNAMLDNFHSLVANIADASAQASTAAEEMSTISNQVNATVSHQEEQVTMVATAITEMSGAIHEVAKNANDTSSNATDADAQASEGRAKVQANLEAIQQLSDAISNASGVIRKLDEQSNDISEVLTVIRNIADQTNLLALNAAIESARAGEAGRGFAVVADEVRSLAQHTQNATQSISDMIGSLQSSAKEAVDTMDTASEQAGVSVQYARESDSILETIAGMISRIADMNIQVSTATEEQASVANEITENVNNFSSGLNEVAESAQQSALASGEIARLAASLQHKASQFKT